MVSTLQKRWCNEYGKTEILLVLPVTRRDDFYLVAHRANSDLECMGLFAVGRASGLRYTIF